ncbi:MAG: thiamine pyrophosphate-dependent dehydrogenase E1 component subunit alpha [Candidatus Thorarchaeota archaeon]|jgi:TPP-dependent pyruvate/acetoin dehydrogenase alpha subunit|nr:thiamine pyrophosphate-dependent dehydrogenase E1 component subunit alpha [Candidatus Thorarchaeota archaeon]TET12089.1 MAG: thiamine pyrophosphate-dependent dehydrogenase E1 component subunit alpha [Candidatus Thorarchaeota archaeon]
MAVTKKKLVDLYTRTLKVRLFEEKVWDLFGENLVPGTLHLYLGQEAVAAGVTMALKKSDWVQSTHRGHGHVVAKGADMKAALAELLGKRTGSCKGKGGSMHITEFKAGVLGATGVVASGLPIAVGAALSCQMRGTKEVVACFFGDGASNNGTFGESLNMSAIWKLPVIWIVENNFYAMGTPITLTCPSQSIAQRAEAYCIPSCVVDGNNAVEVYEATSEAVKRAREGGGPSLIECQTYRMRGHSRFDPAKYRPKEEVDFWLRKDAVETILNSALEKKALTKKEAKDIRRKLQKEVDNAADFAVKSEYPEPQEVLDDVFAEVA